MGIDCVPLPHLRQTWIEYARSCTDTHRLGHAAAFDLVAGLVMSRRFALRFGPRLIYPNRWVMLIGASGTGKNTILDMAKELVAAVNSSLIGTDSTSLPQFWTAFSRQPIGCLFLSEFAAWLQDARKSWNEGMIETITDWYDCPVYRVRELSGRNGERRVFEVRLPFLSLACGTTLEWLEENMSESDIAGGFWARMEPLILPPKEYTYDYPPSPDPAVLKRLIAGLANLGQLPGRELACTDQAKEAYSAWLKARRAKNPADPVWAGAFKRASVSCLKTALTNAVLSCHANVEQDDMDRACAAADLTCDSIISLAGMISLSEWERKLRRVSDLLRLAGERGIFHAGLLTQTRYRPRELEEVVRFLRESCQVDERGDVEEGEKVYVWVGGK